MKFNDFVKILKKQIVKKKEACRHNLTDFLTLSHFPENNRILAPNL
jgi:hypothetical protein